MGVIGLSTFVDKNTCLLKTHELKDCPVVIDGNNIYHHIYRACRIHSHFGGDYDVYRHQITINFKSLLKCGIKPYVVFDGGYTTDNKKLKKCTQRARQRIRNVRMASATGFCQLTPLLAPDTFIQTLNELGIPHVTCQFEADNEIAKLANKLKCPVISNDSDFYVFDLEGGFLPMDYIDFNCLCKKNSDGTKGYYYLHCQKYLVEDFINSFEGLSHPVLPVFATLIGNDFYRPKSSNDIFSNIQLPEDEAKTTAENNRNDKRKKPKRTKIGRKKNKKVTKVNRIVQKVSKVKKVLAWFEMHSQGSGDVLDVVRHLLKSMRSSQKFLVSVDGYFDVINFEACDLFEYFSGNKKDFKPKAGVSFSGYNGTPFPSWFLLSVCNGEITPAIINAAVLHRIFFQCQLEMLQLPTSYNCSDNIRRIIYGILMASDPVKKEFYSVRNRNCENYRLKFLQSVFDKSECSNISANVLLCEGMDKDIDTLSQSDSMSESEIDDESCNDSDDDAEADHEKKDCSDPDEGEIVLEYNEEAMAHDNDKSEILHDDKAKCEIAPASQNILDLKQTHFEEYQREGQDLKKFYVEPLLSTGCEPLPNLSEIAVLDIEKRKTILLNSLGVQSSFVDAFSPDFLLYPICLSIWIQHANPPVTEYHLDCVILCSILLQMQKAKLANKKKRRKGKETSTDPNCVTEECKSSGETQRSRIDIEQICDEGKSTDKFQNTCSNLDKYRSLRLEINQKTRYDSSIPHAFSQLQSVMFEVSNLNKLLRFPFPNIQPAYLMNGTFLYNFFIHLITRPSPSLFIEAVLIKGTDLCTLFFNMKSVLIDSVPKDSFVSLGGNVKKQKKKSRGRKKENSTVCGNVEEKMEEESHSNKESDDDVTVVTGFDVENKFSLLCM